MRKISLVIAMAVILTIGGVFATWTYSDSETINNATQGNIQVSIDMDTSAEGIAGQLAVVTAPTFAINPEDDMVDYDAVLSGTGMTIGFTPSLGSKYTDETSLIVYWTVEVTSDDTNPVFSGTKASGSVTFAPGEANAQMTKDVEVSYIIKAGGLSINAINVPTVSAYEAYEARIANVKITVTLSIENPNPQS